MQFCICLFVMLVVFQLNDGDRLYVSISFGYLVFMYVVNFCVLFRFGFVVFIYSRLQYGVNVIFLVMQVLMLLLNLQYFFFVLGRFQLKNMFFVMFILVVSFLVFIIDSFFICDKNFCMCFDFFFFDKFSVLMWLVIMFWNSWMLVFVSYLFFMVCSVVFDSFVFVVLSMVCISGKFFMVGLVVFKMKQWLCGLMLDWISVVVLEFVWVIRICFMFMMLNCSFVVIRWLMCLEVVISILFFMWLYFFVMDVWFFM